MNETPLRKSPPSGDSSSDAVTVEVLSPPPLCASSSSCDAEEQESSSSSTRLLFLFSSQSSSRHVFKNQQYAETILAANHVDYTSLDGADPALASVRDDLFAISGKTAKYPQFFLIQNDDVTFWGDWERFQTANETGSLREELVRSLVGAAADDDNKATTTTNEDTFQFATNSITFESAALETTTSSTTAPSQASQQPLNQNESTQEHASTSAASSAASVPTTTQQSQQVFPETSTKQQALIETDVTIYGATSFVAQHVLRYLLQASLTLPRPLKVTLAGRSPSKLQDLLQNMTQKMESLLTIHEYRSPTGSCVLDMVIAEASDSMALFHMAQRTQCVLNCAGPFARYSSLVVGACAHTGTDYVDITGEVSWAGAMRQQYGSVAKQTGARIISLCGFDSIPSDIAVFACVEALRLAKRKKNQSGRTVDIDRATTWHVCHGGANGGTIETIVNMPVSVDSLWRWVPFLLDDPLILTHPSTRKNPGMQVTRDRMAWGEWMNQLFSFDSIFQWGVSIPFFMAVANAKVVYASSVALKYGSRFSYRERFLPVGYAFTTKLGPISIIPASIAWFAVMVGGIVLKMPVLGARIANWLLPPGSGMSEDACRRGKTEIYAQAETVKDAQGCTDRASCRIKFEGDPGNWATAQCVTESALCMVLNKTDMPPRSDDGFGTPAELLGYALIQRLQYTSIRPVSFQTDVRLKVSGTDWCMQL
jgi:short subunit dehydrogenase-like uncharacterized protein